MGRSRIKSIWVSASFQIVALTVGGANVLGREENVRGIFPKGKCPTLGRYSPWSRITRVAYNDLEHVTLKRAWHWYNKPFTQWYAIWRASEGRIRDSAREGEIRADLLLRIRWNSACHAGRGDNVQKMFQSFTTCHDELLSCHFREQFVNYEQTRRNYWVTRRANACRDVNILKFSLRPGTHYPHPPLSSKDQPISCK